MRLNKSLATLTSFLGCLLFGMFKVSRLRNINNTCKTLYSAILVNFCEIRKARGNKNCAEIGLIGHFMPIFSIF